MNRAALIKNCRHFCIAGDNCDDTAKPTRCPPHTSPEAEQALSETKAERMAAIETHLARMKKLRKISQRLHEAAIIGVQDVMAFSFYVAEA